MRKLAIGIFMVFILCSVGCGIQSSADDLIESEKSTGQNDGAVANEFETEESFELIEYDVPMNEIDKDAFTYEASISETADRKYLYTVFAKNCTEYDFRGLTFTTYIGTDPKKFTYNGILKAGEKIGYDILSDIKLGSEITIGWECEEAYYTNAPINSSSTFIDLMKGTYDASTSFEDIRYVIGDTTVSKYRGEKLSKEVPFETVEFNGEQCIYIDYGEGTGTIFTHREEGVFIHTVYSKNGELALYVPFYEFNTKNYNWIKRIGGNANALVNPAIGMTADEVKTSLWGVPNKINKSTYSFGVEEQWVYGNGRYIYLKDGIVTAIQE